MPAFYAHYRFGCDVLKQLPEDIRSICTAHRGLFDWLTRTGHLLFLSTRSARQGEPHRLCGTQALRALLFTARTEGHCVCA